MARHRDTEQRQLQAGQRVVDLQADKEGVVLDFACQYAHPKAQPVYTYLVRWQDGQVQAISEGALNGPQGIGLLD